MNTRVRTALQTMRTPPKHDKSSKEMEKEKTGNQGKSPNRIQSRRERKTALQQDVDKLKKKLRHEENVHRALERAFTRPLGALPRLPPYLPSNTLELLAEVAVLEEEVVRLEEQVVNFRQGLYQEAIYISSSKKTKENSSDLYSDQYPSHNPKESATLNASFVTNPSPSMRWPSDGEPNGHSLKRSPSGKKPLKKGNSCSTLSEDRRGKENQLNTNSTKNSKQSPVKKVPSVKIPVHIEKLVDSKSLQSMSDETVFEGSSGPNRLSEDILKCLLSIFSQMSSTKHAAVELEAQPSISGSYEGSEEISFGDPFGLCLEFGRRDVGPYKNFHVVEASSIDPNLITCSSFLIRRLKLLLRRLALVDLAELTHQQKLAFWINMYNACMMNAFIENGIPATPHMVVALMPKAMVNVGGHLLSAMAIEHFILRLPYHSKHTSPKGVKNDEMAARGVFGLDWPEPLVTFALSCGSWSSPAVRVYTASQVENQLETAKREYLQAAVGISMPNKLAIPKLLDWYLLDFAKDVESLMDWICLQLPSELRNEAVKCLEEGRRNVFQQPIQVLPYEFRFRYLLAP